MTENSQPNQDTREFALKRIYVKDISFEAPNSPFIFAKEWKPQSNLNLNSSVNKLESDTYEVTLSVTVTAKDDDKTVFLVEVEQAGIFLMKNFPENEMGHMLGAYCPNILFPYAREVVSDLVNKGSFPQLLLHPVNFDALYNQHLQQVRQQSAEQPADKEGDGETTH